MKLGCGVDPSFLCPRCDFRFKWKSDLKKHLMEIHKVERSQLATFGLGIFTVTTKLTGITILNSLNANIGPLNRQSNEKCGK